MDFLQKILFAFPTDPLELAGLFSGLLCVFLLVKENIWVWPVGLFYACVSVFVFLEERLFASMFESLYYIGMNAYGWYFWKRGQGNAKHLLSLHEHLTDGTPSGRGIRVRSSLLAAMESFIYNT